MNSVSPGTWPKRCATQSAFARSMRACVEATKFHHRSRSPSSDAPPQIRSRPPLAEQSVDVASACEDLHRCRPNGFAFDREIAFDRIDGTFGVLVGQHNATTGRETVRRRTTSANRRVPAMPCRTRFPRSRAIARPRFPSRATWRHRNAGIRARRLRSGAATRATSASHAGDGPPRVLAPACARNGRCRVRRSSS